MNECGFDEDSSSVPTCRRWFQCEHTRTNTHVTGRQAHARTRAHPRPPTRRQKHTQSDRSGQGAYGACHCELGCRTPRSIMPIAKRHDRPGMQQQQQQQEDESAGVLLLPAPLLSTASLSTRPIDRSRAQHACRCCRVSAFPPARLLACSPVCVRVCVITCHHESSAVPAEQSQGVLWENACGLACAHGLWVQIITLVHLVRTRLITCGQHSKAGEERV
jgi:hypothetical protein